MTAALSPRDVFQNCTSAKNRTTTNRLHPNMFGGTRSLIADIGCECMQSSKSFTVFFKKTTTSQKWL
jgi:hypothetical protein